LITSLRRRIFLWAALPTVVILAAFSAYDYVTASRPATLAYDQALLSTALSTVAWNIGVSRLGIAVGGLWQNTVPVFAVLISLAFFGVVPTGTQVLGGAVVLAGVAIMQWHSIRATRALPRPAAAR